jgi:5S rRNA maturation endonuclease (ribonuclease M5)
MRHDYSTPVVGSRLTRSTRTSQQGEPDEEKQVDYSHLDIIAEVERIIERRLIRHTRTSGKYHCACPFPDCTSKHDAFTVWDRSQLEARGDGRREVHFWCGRCGRAGSLISLLRQYREATTGEQLSWADAARALRIDPRTWRAIDDSDQDTPRRETASARRRQQVEQQRKAEEDERATLDALYRWARVWLATGQVTMKDGRTVALDQARSYVLARGYTLAQAAQLGLAYIPTVQEVPELANLVAHSWRGRILFPLTGPVGASGYAGRTVWRWTPGMTAEQHKQILDAWNEQHPNRRILRHYKTHQPAYYGYEDAYRASTLVIVEGEFDAASVRLALIDMPDIAVCAFGTNVQARLVPVNVLHVVLALDIDQAGRDAIKRLIDALHARGITVNVALPPTGKDWNDCHQLTGLEAIRAEIIRACKVTLADASTPDPQCSLSQPEDIKSAPANAPRQCEQESDHRDQGQQITMMNNYCPRHYQLLRYEDELGGRYCDHVDCWERYRLMHHGAAYGYPALSGIIDPRDYLPDTSQAPLYHTTSGLPVYPSRPALSQHLIAAGADAWHTYTSERTYPDIDLAIKALTRAGKVVLP